MATRTHLLDLPESERFRAVAATRAHMIPNLSHLAELGWQLKRTCDLPNSERFGAVAAARARVLPHLKHFMYVCMCSVCASAIPLQVQSAKYVTGRTRTLAIES